MFDLNASSKPYLLTNVGPTGFFLVEPTGLEALRLIPVYSPMHLLTSMAPVDFYRPPSTKNGAIILLSLLDLF